MINKVKRYRKIVKDISDTRRTIRKLHQLEPHELKLAKIERELGEDILEAQRLHASVYLRRGFVDESDIENGVLSKTADPHQQHALYFVLKKTNRQDRQYVAASARQIEYDPQKGFLSFPVVEKADINLHMLKELVSYDPTKCVEISGLVKHRETPSSTVLLLYRSMWHYSLKHKHQLWIMACDVRLYQRLKILFGPAIKKIGKETSYKGGNVIPAMLSPLDALYEFIRISRRRAWLFGISRSQLINFFVQGLSRDDIPAEDLEYLDKILKK